ncbi:chemokine-like factor [Onychostruthus taczanowskii]|uniref:chemokine-like factor n=1 Tax=Onychostruthus taczanowskii TaxID=356909 RepID=UPI001B80C8A8|nr:chemokine-like factor [Onychostruthus taczanowskii]
MAPASPAGSAPASPRLPGSSRGPGAAAQRPGRSAAMARVQVDRAFPRSPRGALKIARTLVALAALLCFVASGAHGAYTALAGMETVITALFLLLYLLRLDSRMRCLFWPLADIFNSVIAALFLLVVALFAIIIKTNKGILAGGVLGLILLVLCIVDVVLLCKKISLDKARGRSAPAK